MIRSFYSSSFLTSSRRRVSFCLSFSVASMKFLRVSASLVDRLRLSVLVWSLSLVS
jgi:hypothetical protein